MAPTVATWDRWYAKHGPGLECLTELNLQLTVAETLQRERARVVRPQSRTGRRSRRRALTARAPRLRAHLKALDAGIRARHDLIKEDEDL